MRETLRIKKAYICVFSPSIKIKVKIQHNLFTDIWELILYDSLIEGGATWTHSSAKNHKSQMVHQSWWWGKSRCCCIISIYMMIMFTWCAVWFSKLLGLGSTLQSVFGSLTLPCRHDPYRQKLRGRTRSHMWDTLPRTWASQQNRLLV